MELCHLKLEPGQLYNVFNNEMAASQSDHCTT